MNKRDTTPKKFAHIKIKDGHQSTTKKVEVGRNKTPQPTGKANNTTEGRAKDQVHTVKTGHTTTKSVGKKINTKGPPPVVEVKDSAVPLNYEEMLKKTKKDQSQTVVFCY